MNHAPTENYNPTSFFTSESPCQDRVLLFLNTPITSKALITTLWRTCATRICADGGANRLFEVFDDEHERKQYVSELVFHV